MWELRGEEVSSSNSFLSFLPLIFCAILPTLFGGKEPQLRQWLPHSLMRRSPNWGFQGFTSAVILISPLSLADSHEWYDTWGMWHHCTSIKLFLAAVHDSMNNRHFTNGEDIEDLQLQSRNLYNIEITCWYLEINPVRGCQNNLLFQNLTLRHWWFRRRMKNSHVKWGNTASEGYKMSALDKMFNYTRFSNFAFPVLIFHNYFFHCTFKISLK